MPQTSRNISIWLVPVQWEAPIFLMPSAFNSLNQTREAVRSFYNGVYGDIVIGHGELDFLGVHDFLLSIFSW